MTSRASVFTAVVIAVFAGVFAAAIDVGHAQERAGCVSFQACLARAQLDRWTQLAQLIETSATNLAAVRRALTQARASGDAARVSALEALLARAEADWAAKRALADTLRGADYRGFLLARAADLEQHLQNSETALRRKTDEFRRLRSALDRQSESEVRTMRAAALEEGKVAADLARSSFATAFDAAAVLLGAPGLRAVADRLKRQEIEQGVTERKYAEAVGQTGQYALEQLHRRGGVPPSMRTAVERSGHVLGIAEVGFGLVGLALTHVEFEEAQRRQAAVLDVGTHYQFEIHRLGEVVKLARAERDRGREAIARQAAFEAQFVQSARRVEP